MKEQFQHTATNSFLLWFDHFLLSKGEAFSNKTGLFYKYSDPRLGGGFYAFGSPFKQWVNDSSISGATIPSGVYYNNFFYPRSSDLKLDFTNGRFLSKSSFSQGQVSGAFAVKDFNVYHTNEAEDDLLINKKFKSNPRVYSIIENYIDPYDPVVPAIFISSSSMNNEPFAFGGMDSSSLTINAIVIADNAFHLDGALSIFADSKNINIPLIPMAHNPTNEWGDLKSGIYSYENLAAQYSHNEFPMYIEDVTTSKMTDRARKAISNDLFIGFIDFELKTQRNPRL